MALAALERLSPESMKESDLWDKMYEKFHGTGEEDNMPLKEQAWRGISMFAGLYKKETQAVTNVAASSDVCNAAKYVLKSCLHRLENKHIVVDGPGGMMMTILELKLM